ncbi:LpxI family protein [Roseibium litorale]|uniref:UDP-2,3-diacylglucosamine diphosphatase LpxI n=1 Tax=Roseibium litorale TaxID=2803841 RepID=A0ABR9CKW3_9HYPH|nr:UDP-2,3-diacylglucosamine diphosphatase LpxI [Roseibium litorale]MBD8891055.1 UDP-2,3-diacylglucosamine diphosphatase LpxI [Roseibium litorale]
MIRGHDSKDLLTAGASLAPVALICGNGMLPLQVLNGLRAAGRQAFIVAIKGEAEEVLKRQAAVELGWGEIGRLFKVMAAAGCREVVLIGGISKRPDFTSVMGDLGTLRRLPRIIKALSGGDDSLLTKVIGLIEEEGFRVVGIKDVAPDLLAGPGSLGQVKPRAEDLKDMALALEAARRLGDLDIGQAAVALGGRVIAVEGAEGTDAMLARCAELRQNGRVRAKGRLGVLVKTVKPGQDLRVDLPAVGPMTIERAQAAGFAGIAVEAGGALIAEREATVAAADKAGLFLYGLDPQTAPESDA